MKNMEHDTAYNDRQELIHNLSVGTNASTSHSAETDSTSAASSTGQESGEGVNRDAQSLSRTEATCQWFDERDRYWEEDPEWYPPLRDDGRSFGYGESYSERNA